MRKIYGYTVLTVLTADLLASSGDVVATWTSPMYPKLYSNDSDVNPFGRPITPEEDSWIGSLVNIGGMIGPFPYGLIAERYGRKVGLLCVAIPEIISYLTLAFSETVYMYYFARLLGGFAVGGGYAILPMYIAEVSEDASRGLMSNTLQIFWAIGNLIPYVIGPYLPVLWFNVILACAPTTFFILFFIVAPESPHYLTVKNKIDLAEKSLMRLRSKNKKLVEHELEQMKEEASKHDDKVTILEFFKTKVFMKGLLISLVLIAAQQLSGINAVLFYTQNIFEDAGVTDISPEISSMIIGFVILFSSFVAPFVVDRGGRRILILISLMGNTLSLLAFGIFFYLKNSTDVNVSSISWLPLTSLICFIITFILGMGPMPWIVSSELFPTNVKSYSASIVSSTSALTSFVVTKFFNDMEAGLTQAGTFWFYSGCCFLAWVFTWFFLPETKGKSFQEIQEILERSRKGV